jgi:hypothetical protein
MILEIEGGVDHAQYLDDVPDPIEIAAQRLAHRGNQHQPKLTGMAVAVFDREISAELAARHFAPTLGRPFPDI